MRNSHCWQYAGLGDCTLKNAMFAAVGFLACHKGTDPLCHESFHVFYLLKHTQLFAYKFWVAGDADEEIGVLIVSIDDRVG